MYPFTSLLAELKTAWSFRELLYFLVWRDIKVRYKQTVIGILWVILQPLITMVVFGIIFGNVAKISSGNIPYPIFLYSGLIYWNFFSRSIISSNESLISNQSLVKRVSFPKIILPIASIGVNFVDFFFSSLILIFLMVYFHISLSFWGLLFAGIGLLAILLLSIGLGVILASLNAVYRDIRYVTQYAVQLLLFLTPIIYPQYIVPEKYRVLFWINPMAGIIDTLRSALLETNIANLTQFSIAFLLSLLIFLGGVKFFKKREKMIVDVL